RRAHLPREERPVYRVRRRTWPEGRRTTDAGGNAPRIHGVAPRTRREPPVGHRAGWTHLEGVMRRPVGRCGEFEKNLTFRRLWFIYSVGISSSDKCPRGHFQRKFALVSLRHPPEPNQVPRDPPNGVLNDFDGNWALHERAVSTQT